jgi:hypothetical protein
MLAHDRRIQPRRDCLQDYQCSQQNSEPTGRHPISANRDLLLGTPRGTKNVITFDEVAPDSTAAQPDSGHHRTERWHVRRFAGIRGHRLGFMTEQVVDDER